MKINARLKTIGDLVEKDSICLDVGCDHALLDIYLVHRKSNIKTIASDIAQGPLEQAKKCEDCQWKWKMCFIRTQTEPICYKPDKYETCENYFKYHDIQELFMEEYEVEDE